MSRAGPNPDSARPWYARRITKVSAAVLTAAARASDFFSGTVLPFFITAQTAFIAFTGSTAVGRASLSVR